MIWKLLADLTKSIPSSSGDRADDPFVGGRLDLGDSAFSLGGEPSGGDIDGDERRRREQEEEQEQERLAEEEEEQRAEKKRLREEEEASIRRVNSIIAAYEIGRLDRRR